MVGGRLLFWSVVGFFTAIGWWFFRSVVPLVGGGYFLGKWSVVGGRCHCSRWSVVGGWSVGGGFVLRLTEIAHSFHIKLRVPITNKFFYFADVSMHLLDIYYFGLY